MHSKIFWENKYFIKKITWLIENKKGKFFKQILHLRIGKKNPIYFLENKSNNFFSNKKYFLIILFLTYARTKYFKHFVIYLSKVSFVFSFYLNWIIYMITCLSSVAQNRYTFKSLVVHWHEKSLATNGEFYPKQTWVIHLKNSGWKWLTIINRFLITQIMLFHETCL